MEINDSRQDGLRRALDTRQKHLDHARHAAKAKPIFMASVSYEIREPLGGITGVTDLTKLGELSQPLMKDVYGLAMVEAGDMKVMNEPFDLAGLLTALVQTHSPAETESTFLKRNTGIGLATAQKISLLMGGDLQVQSDTDVGTVFTMTETWPLSS